MEAAKLLADQSVDQKHTQTCAVCQATMLSHGLMTSNFVGGRDHELRGLAVIDFCKEDNEINITPDMLKNVKV